MESLYEHNGVQGIFCMAFNDYDLLENIRLPCTSLVFVCSPIGTGCQTIFPGVYVHVHNYLDEILWRQEFRYIEQVLGHGSTSYILVCSPGRASHTKQKVLREFLVGQLPVVLQKRHLDFPVTFECLSFVVKISATLNLSLGVFL